MGPPDGSPHRGLMETRAWADGPHALGRWGEDRAVGYLRRHGWTILARNYRFGRREVDIVASRSGVVAFVEVKTRAGGGFGRPEEAITGLKRREIEAVATQFLARHTLADVEVRFDAVAIVLDRGLRTVRIHHVEDAWRPGWI
jgi:putative endonuclease